MPKKLTKSRLSAYIFLLINTFIWGLAFPIVKKGFDSGLTPSTFLLGRYFFATLFSLPLLFLFKNQKNFKNTFKLKSISKVVLLEILGTIIALSLLYQGLVRTTAIEATLISITWPIFVTAGGIIFLREKEEAHEWLGLILAIIGTTLLVVKPFISQGINGSTTGNLLIVGQNLTIAAYYLLAKKHYQKLNKWAIAHISFWVGLFGFATISIATRLSPLQQLSSLFTMSNPFPLLSVLYMAIFGSIIGLTFYLIGQSKIEASEAAVFTYLQPMVAIPVSMIMLGEHISLIEIVAIVIIVIGVILAQKR